MPSLDSAGFPFSAPQFAQRPDFGSPRRGPATSLLGQLHLKWSGRLQLDDAVSVRPQVMPGVRWQAHECAGNKRLSVTCGSLLTKRHTQLPRKHGEKLGGGMPMRRNFVTRWELETHSKRTLLG